MEFVQEMIAQYGYLALYCLLALGIIGLPIPDEVLMTFVGYLASMGILRYTAAVVVSLLGSMSGMILSYELGRKIGKPLVWKFGKWIWLTPKRLEKAEGWFNRYGKWAVSFGYFIPGIRHLTCYLSGVSGMKRTTYWLFAAIGAVVWCVLFITIGYFIGVQFV
ncbi:DedA family protein [Paenibacillus sp. 32O-W]|uniref:DedA family protein n=1 Tax=Paenibacillus sp. 32O-W TaxID=1695218 RepID=UPI0011A2804F|nr:MULTISPECIES: DedA family protein [Paenibacillaceae]